MALRSYQKTDKVSLSKNFVVREFICHGKGCCSQVQVDDKLVEYLQKIRDRFDRPVVITSGYCCAIHNERVGGVANSLHTKGMAADIVIMGVEPAEVAAYAEEIGVKGIGLYERDDCGKNFVHIDTRDKKGFWYGYKQAQRETFAAPQCTVPLKVLKMGSRGTAVEVLQRLLIGRGYDCGVSGADGNFGCSTDKALRAYQTAMGLSVDGIAGENTWKTILGVE